MEADSDRIISVLKSRYFPTKETVAAFYKAVSRNPEKRDKNGQMIIKHRRPKAGAA